MVGTLSILMIGRIARRLFGSTLLGVTAALLLAIDGQDFVHSRIGLLDVFVMFWALTAFGCLLIDRDGPGPRRARSRVGGAAVAGGSGGGWRGVWAWASPPSGRGCFFAAVFGMSVLWDLAARRPRRRVGTGC